jgi:hypothetical protein
LKSRVDSHVERLLREARSFLDAGRGREASLRFSRVLLDDPRHEGARRGEERARALFNEEERQAAMCLQQAQLALAAGQMAEARQKAAAAQAQGADPDRVQPLLDDLDGRGGRLAETDPAPRAAAADGLSRPGRRAALPRTALVTAFALGLAVLLGAVATSWERIVGTLSRAPAPTTTAAGPVATLPTSSPGEAALQEARRLLSTGQAESALRTLDRIPAQDPTYPYARRLRAEAEARVSAGVGR